MNINKIAGSLALIAGLATASGLAQADTIYSMGTLSSNLSFQNASNPANTFGFTDTFNFNITSVSDVTASIGDLAYDLVTPYYTVTVFKDNNLFLSLNGGAPIGNKFSTTIFSLVAGNYSAIVTGDAVGAAGGYYSVAMSAHPVPVPAAVWLLGSGLIGLVGVARRKEQA
jgi:hypothetical protein